MREDLLGEIFLDGNGYSENFAPAVVIASTPGSPVKASRIYRILDRERAEVDASLNLLCDAGILDRNVDGIEEYSSSEIEYWFRDEAEKYLDELEAGPEAIQEAVEYEIRNR